MEDRIGLLAYDLEPLFFGFQVADFQRNFCQAMFLEYVCEPEQLPVPTERAARELELIDNHNVSFKFQHLVA
jgi:hypothetical protein